MATTTIKKETPANLGLGSANQNVKFSTGTGTDQGLSIEANVVNSNWSSRLNHRLTLVVEENNLLLYDQTTHEVVWEMPMKVVDVPHGGTAGNGLVYQGSLTSADDLNNITTSGYWAIASSKPSNAPNTAEVSSNYATFINIVTPFNNEILQRYIVFNNYPRTYERRILGSTIGNWYLLDQLPLSVSTSACGVVGNYISGYGNTLSVPFRNANRYTIALSSVEIYGFTAATSGWTITNQYNDCFLMKNDTDYHGRAAIVHFTATMV